MIFQSPLYLLSTICVNLNLVLLIVEEVDVLQLRLRRTHGIP